MLKITMHDSPTTLTFQVEGKLVGAWAKELEQVWNSVSSNRNQRVLVVDLTQTLFIDEEGKRILTKLFRDGAFFRTSGTLNDSIVAEITGKPGRPWRGILANTLLLILAVGIARAADPMVGNAILSGFFPIAKLIPSGHGGPPCEAPWHAARRSGPSPLSAQHVAHQRHHLAAIELDAAPEFVVRQRPDAVFHFEA